MSMYTQFGTDDDLETNGIDLDYGDFKITIARAGGANKKFNTVLARKSKKYKRAMEADIMDNDVALNVLYEVFAETVILNWQTKVDGVFKKGIENKKDAELLPVNKDNILMTFQMLPDLFIDIRVQATEISEFKTQEQEQDSVN